MLVFASVGLGIGKGMASAPLSNSITLVLLHLDTLCSITAVIKLVGYVHKTRNSLRAKLVHIHVCSHTGPSTEHDLRKYFPNGHEYHL